MSVKIERLEGYIVEEVSHIINEEVKDDDIKFVTITDCKLTSDLSFAKLYFTCLEDSKREKITIALNNASSFIRRNLANRVDMRHIPELTFVYDESIEYGKKIEDLIEKINEEK